MIARLSSTETIVSKIRDEIVTGRLEPGAPLRQDELATRFGVSHIPVREALRALEGEGLVEIRPRRGAIVAPLSADEFEEICEMRVALETAALRLAIPLLKKSDLALAAALLDRIDRDPKRWGSLNSDFHCALYAAAQRPRMLDAIRTLHRNAERYLHLELRITSNHVQSQREHRRLLRAIGKGDITGSCELLTAHISDDAQQLLKTLRQ